MLRSIFFPHQPALPFLGCSKRRPTKTSHCTGYPPSSPPHEVMKTRPYYSTDPHLPIPSLPGYCTILPPPHFKERCGTPSGSSQDLYVLSCFLDRRRSGFPSPPNHFPLQPRHNELFQKSRSSLSVAKRDLFLIIPRVFFFCIEIFSNIVEISYWLGHTSLWPV